MYLFIRISPYRVEKHNKMQNKYKYTRSPSPSISNNLKHTNTYACCVGGVSPGGLGGGGQGRLLCRAAS